MERRTQSIDACKNGERVVSLMEGLRNEREKMGVQWIDVVFNSNLKSLRMKRVEKKRNDAWKENCWVVKGKLLDGV